MDFHDYAHDLRLLADILDQAAPDLPIPKYATIPLTIDIGAAEQRDVLIAANALGVNPKITDTGHTTATLMIDTVELRFIHITDTAMGAYKAKQAFAATMPAGWPGSVLKPGYTPALDAS